MSVLLCCVQMGYSLHVVLDLGFLRHCYGSHAAISLQEYKERVSAVGEKYTTI